MSVLKINKPDTCDKCDRTDIQAEYMPGTYLKWLCPIHKKEKKNE